MRPRKKKAAALPRSEEIATADPRNGWLFDREEPWIRDPRVVVDTEPRSGHGTEVGTKSPLALRREGKSGLVVFRELPTTPLVRVDLDQLEDASVSGAIVKVTAELRPSQREAFDAGAVRAQLLERGALAVVVAPTVLPEAPTAEAKEEVAKASGPEEAIVAWFAGLTAVPESDRVAALDVALALLGEEAAK